MNNNELTLFYRDTVINDQDAISATDDSCDQWLRLAYGEFRRLITDLAPEFYEISYTPPAPITDFELDLNGILFGTTVTQKRCQKITRIVIIDPAAPAGARIILQPCLSFEELKIPFAYGQRWFLDGHKLKFNYAAGQNIQIWYYADPDISFLPGAAATFLDDAATFHELIAMIASRYYTIKTGIQLPDAKEQIVIQTKALKQFFRSGRSGTGPRTVRDTYRFPYGR